MHTCLRGHDQGLPSYSSSYTEISQGLYLVAELTEELVMRHQSSCDLKERV